MINVVKLTKRAEKSLAKVPKHVAANFFLWKQEVESHGVEAVRVIAGYHDEPIKGPLKGIVRSVRVGLGYRVFYRAIAGTVKCLMVEDVNRHDYKEIERLFGL